MPSRPVRVVTQGPSEPVRVVTQGIADPVRIVTGTPSDPVRVVTSGVSTPVKIVEGSLDPIGDGLRADVVAYWKMEEDSGTRIDATGHGHDLIVGAGNPGSVGGKVDNAISWVGDSLDVNTPYLINLDIFNLQDFTVAQWLRIISYTTSFYEATALDIGVTSYFYINIGKPVGYERIAFADTDTVGLLEVPISSGWHFAVAWRAGDQTYLQVDNGIPVSQTSATTVWDTSLVLGIAISSAMTFYQDEVSLFGRALTSDERTYLWNDGTGRTLFP